jgi:hypothetical protein
MRRQGRAATTADCNAGPSSRYPPSKIGGQRDIHQLDRDLDHLRSLGRSRRMRVSWTTRAFRSWGPSWSVPGNIHVTPTPLAINLYVRANAVSMQYFKVAARQR